MQRVFSQRRNWKQSPCSKDSPVPGQPPALGCSEGLCLFVTFHYTNALSKTVTADDPSRLCRALFVSSLPTDSIELCFPAV